MSTTTVTVAYGDGIGPEIMSATLRLLKKAGAKITIETIEIGEKAYKQDYTSGLSLDALEVIKRNKVLLKAPITTPQGKGYKSLNVTLRQVLGLFANVRPTASYATVSDAPNMDLVIVRENEEDIYSGIEYRSTQSSYLALKLISHQGSEKIIRYAFEYARTYKRQKVTCIVKDNIMKITDGVFHKIFDQVAKEYPEIKNNTYIVDIGAARIAANPAEFDVVVTLNLYGDILSDIASEVSGSVGLSGSANIGNKYAMFEAVHGSAPDIAGLNIANPSGLMNAAAMMLDHIAQHDISTKIRNALLKTIEDGVHTADIYKEGVSIKKVSTTEFTDTVITNLGKQAQKLLASTTNQVVGSTSISPRIVSATIQNAVGVDIYISDSDLPLVDIVNKVQLIQTPFTLANIAQRGLVIWPNSAVEEVNGNMLRLRFMASQHSVSNIHQDIISLQYELIVIGLIPTLVHTLYEYDGTYGFSKAQGE